MADIQKIVEEIKNLSVLEVSELVKKLEKEFDVSPMTMAPAAAPTEGAAAEAEERSEYNLEVTNAGENKINVIKALREFRQDLGLKDAKELIDSVPSVVAENIPADEAQEMKAKLEETGATVELK